MNVSKRCKIKQSPANLNEVIKHKGILQISIKDSISKPYKKNWDFFRVLGTKKDNEIEPLYDNALNTYIVKDKNQ